MKRLTSNNYHEMDMVQMALNQVYIKDNWTWYVNGPEDHFSICDLIRSAAETLGAEPPPQNDEELSDLMTDWLYYGVDEVEGVLGILYRALWAMAEIRAELSRYEDTGLEPDDVTDLMAAHGTAIGALAEYRAIGTVKDLRALIEAPPNNPLTPEELRGMDGEPVWIERCCSDCSDVRRWALVDLEYEMCRTARGGLAVFEMYGKTWRAYRRKPEEG